MIHWQVYIISSLKSIKNCLTLDSLCPLQYLNWKGISLTQLRWCAGNQNMVTIIIITIIIVTNINCPIVLNLVAVLCSSGKRGSTQAATYNALKLSNFSSTISFSARKCHVAGNWQRVSLQLCFPIINLFPIISNIYKCCYKTIS